MYRGDCSEAYLTNVPRDTSVVCLKLTFEVVYKNVLGMVSLCNAEFVYTLHSYLGVLFTHQADTCKASQFR